MGRVVFVADDLGIAPGVDDGIAAAADNGMVREASLCVTGASAVRSVQVAKAHGIGVGLHFSLTLGRALSGPIRGLTDAEGRFKDLGPALLACHARAVDRDAVAREVEAQLLALRELGVAPTHFNGHHHVHCWPVVRDVCFAAAARHGIHWTRLPAESAAIGGRWNGKRLVLASMARRSRRQVAAAGLRTLPFVGAVTEARLDFAERFAEVVGKLPDRDVEWMVHPRVPDAEFARLDPRGKGLEPAARAELATLTAPATKAMLTAAGFEVVGFSGVE